MPFVKVGRVEDLARDSVREAMLAGRPYAICNAAGEIHALSGVCPHSGGPLGQGQIHDGRVVCPYHLWEFDCRTGAYDYHPALGVETFEVRIEDGEILVGIP